MKECVGLFGKLFGHKFKSYLKTYISNNLGGNFKGHNLEEVLEARADKEYIVICKRCGIKK